MLGLVGKADLIPGATVLLGQVPPGGGTINVRFANRGGVDSRCWLWIGNGAAPANADIVTPGVLVSGGCPYEDMGLAVSEDEKVWVRSDASSVTARAHGM